MSGTPWRSTKFAQGLRDTCPWHVLRRQVQFRPGGSHLRFDGWRARRRVSAKALRCLAPMTTMTTMNHWYTSTPGPERRSASPGSDLPTRTLHAEFHGDHYTSPSRLRSTQLHRCRLREAPAIELCKPKYGKTAGECHTEGSIGGG